MKKLELENLKHNKDWKEEMESRLLLYRKVISWLTTEIKER